MLRKLVFLSFLLPLGFTFSQDTTWVQTFTFDSITTRRANFTFPQELNDKRFEKVLMYYKLKCSPLTTWDQYNCGEWDYLTYTRVFDHTGEFDSVQVNGNKYLANLQSPPSLVYDPLTAVYSDTYVRSEHNRSASNLNNSLVNSANGTSAFPFDVTNHGGRFQMLLSASELTAAGVVAGDLQSLSLYVNNTINSGELKYPRISLKSTLDANLITFHSAGFTEVYDAAHWANGSQAELAIGQNELLFYQPFAWNGTDNIIIEFYFENSMDAANSILFDSESIAPGSAVYYNDLNGCIEFDGTNHSLLELSDFDMGNEMTIAFWAKGNGAGGTNTSILEAYDIAGNRVINIHMPWSDNSMYFDAGQGSGYDRINKVMTAAEMDNNWNHWAFVKKQSTGEMFIYKNGTLWHSGTNKNLPIGYVHRFVLGSNMNQGYMWKGMVDEFQVYDAALTQATIQSWMQTKATPAHPNWADLLTYFDFDGQAWAEDQSQNNYLLMPSEQGMFNFDELPYAGIQEASARPVISIGQGTVAGANVVTEEVEIRRDEPTVIYELQAVTNHFEIVNAYVGTLSGNETVYNATGQVVTQTPYTCATSILNEAILYFQTPYEIVHDVEIARYITPYGIQFDLGPQGFSWIYDVTDYQQYLKDVVDLAAHNTQELLDLKFAFIEGIPPRDVHKREPIWADFGNYNFANLANDISLPATDVSLSDTSGMFKIKTRLSGHGQVGNGACCEWVPNNHQVKIDGVSRFNWNIWQTTECGDNPNISQGGTWPYAREGWCPGDLVRENEFELTPFVVPGGTVSIDYAINQVPTNDPGQAGGNYIMAMDLISYSAPNFQNDAAIIDILNPNNYEYYRKWNPTCSNPRVIIQNTGEQPLTKCTIRCWVSYGDWLEYEWTGNLGFLEKEVVEIPVQDLGWWRDYSGTMTFTAQVHSVGGYPDLDEYENNNVKSVKFKAPETINGPFFVWFTTNNKASENNYRLEDASGTILFERNNLANTTQYKDTFDLAPGCYSIILEDSDHDGIGFWYSSQVEGETTGQFRLRQVGGSYLEFFPADFGHYHRYNFSVGFSVGLEDKVLDHKIAIIPNPTNGECTIEVSGTVNGNADMTIIDHMGRMVYTEKMNATVDFAESHVNIQSLPAGHYLVKIVTGDRVYTEPLIKY
ncbi:MAG: peptide-N-glycosidase F-related protein [Crocinitomicaceae bacterium]|nr:peptide-N-glycosidase F-related protein [Crocinitomicaceae bacterium]